MKCDNCEHYEWYYDYCQKWKCEVDARASYGCFKSKENQYNEDYQNERRFRDVDQGAYCVYNLFLDSRQVDN